jgi:hypothetical protein
MRIFIVIVVCMILTGCESMALKRGGLYINKSTCVGMDDLGVATVKSGF